jgi:ribosomal protein S18 acetylase RimI-like enzyme
MADVLIRTVRRGDGVACARLWRELGELFATMNPHTFQVPAAEGLAEWFEEVNAIYLDKDDKVALVAEADGVLVGSVSAALHEPVPSAQRQLQTDLGRRRLHVDSLGVASSHRRDGVGSALMQAVEDWGRARGAEVILLETEANNPMSVPFYENRMGFTAENLVFRKEIAGSGARRL